MQLPSASRDCARLLVAEFGTCQWLSLALINGMRDVQLRLVDLDVDLLQNCNGRSTLE
jgi:hypothetical protein